MEAMADQIFAYVPHSRQKRFEELGWEYSTDLGPPHCAYASLYKWAGDGLPVYPKDDISVYRAPLTRSEQDENKQSNI